MFEEFLLRYRGLIGAKACKSCGSRKEFSNSFEQDPHANEYSLAKIGVEYWKNQVRRILVARGCLGVYSF